MVKISSNGITVRLYSSCTRICYPLYQLSSLVALWADSSPLVMKVDTRDCKSRCSSRHLTVITQWQSRVWTVREIFVLVLILQNDFFRYWYRYWYCDITTRWRGKHWVLHSRVSTFITSGYESAQRATSDESWYEGLQNPVIPELSLVVIPLLLFISQLFDSKTNALTSGSALGFALLHVM